MWAKKFMNEFVFAFPSRERMSLLVNIFVGGTFVSGAVSLIIQGEFVALSWVVVASMWFAFFLLAQKMNESIYKRQRKLIEMLLDDQKKLLGLCEELQKHAEIQAGVRSIL
jgi:hypothetical protein